MPFPVQFLRTVGGLLAFCIPLILAGCSAKEKAVSESTAVPSAGTVTRIDPATAGTITGTVKFDGASLPGRGIDMSADPGCKGTNESETVVVNHGDLANVFVYIKDGLGNQRFAIPEAATLSQQGCRYRPHLLGVMVGQKLRIHNDDPTNHNIHAMPKQNPEWNQSQMPSAPVLEKSFNKEELMIPLKCNQHPWMKAYVNVVANPFFAVTDQDGKYEIRGLPPGEYTLGFVHERLGEQTRKTTLAAKETKAIDVSFRPTAE